MRVTRVLLLSPLSAAMAAVLAAPAGAQDNGGDAQALAKQLSNPVASLISVPLQLNGDSGLGPDGDGERFTLNIQPVVPISVGDDWNMISRTILPITSQRDLTARGESEFGLGDALQSLFFSPKTPGKSGIIWGVGPAFLLPTATETALGSEKWGVGPTVVVLKQSGKATFGMLANHIWSVAGDEDRADLSQTFFQPFVSYTTAQATTYGLNAETSYNWIADSLTLPVNVTISQLTKLGKQPIQFGAGVRYYVDKPEGGPDWGVRLNLTFLFPAGG